MKFYYGSNSIKSKKESLGVCHFSIPEYGILSRSLILTDDKKTLEFSSIILLLQFILLNPLFFRGVRNFDMFGSNQEIIQYLKNVKTLPKYLKDVNEVCNVLMEKVINNFDITIEFFKILERKNYEFFKVDSMRVDMSLALKLTALSKEYLNEKIKNQY